MFTVDSWVIAISVVFPLILVAMVIGLAVFLVRSVLLLSVCWREARRPGFHGQPSSFGEKIDSAYFEPCLVFL